MIGYEMHEKCIANMEIRGSGDRYSMGLMVYMRVVLVIQPGRLGQ